MAGSACSSSPDDEGDGLLGTPTSRMWKGAGPQGGATQIRNKAQVMDLLPTPAACVANDGEDVAHWDERRERIKAKGINGNGMGEPLTIAAQRLLPTPLTSDTNGTGPADVAKDFSTPLRAIASLLSTPSANVGTNGGSQHPDKRRAGNHQPRIQDVAEHVLLPTPRATDGPKGAVSATATTERRVAEGRANLAEFTVELAKGTNWGPYAPAIRRWEAVLGRPAPSPTEPNKNGNPRLSPKFTEWMMGVPEGWITSIPISRNEQLKACGNGVVPQQAAVALGDMLAAFGEAP